MMLTTQAFLAYGFKKNDNQMKNLTEDDDQYSSYLR